MSKKTIITILIIFVLLAVGLDVLSQKTDWLEKEYKNKEVGISFTYPFSWKITNDEFVKVNDDLTHYWIKLDGDNGELSFNIFLNHQTFGGFVLNENDKLKYHKLSTADGINIWRPNIETISSSTAIQNLYRQPKPETLTKNKWHAFKFMAPELDQTNNVGDLFDGGSERIEYGSSTLTITGGINLKNLGKGKNALEKIDKIVSYIKLNQPKLPETIETPSVDKSNWQTYENKEYGFSIKYPEGYSQFKLEKGVKGNFYASSSEAILVKDGYNRYPKLDIDITSIDEYEFRGWGGPTYGYDTDQDSCYMINRDRRTSKPFDISSNGWQGCKVGTGDAGWASSGYYIPHEDKGIILEISNSSHYGTNRDIPFKEIVKTLKFID